MLPSDYGFPDYFLVFLIFFALGFLTLALGRGVSLTPVLGSGVCVTPVLGSGVSVTPVLLRGVSFCSGFK